MYKLEIKLGWLENETITIETSDVEKIIAIQEFVAFQEEAGWGSDYVAVEDIQEDELEYDENGVAWFQDEDGVWFFLDEETDEFVEWDGTEEDEEESEEDEEESEEDEIEAE